MTDSVPSTPAPSDEGPPTSGQVEAQPMVLGGYEFREREGLSGIVYRPVPVAGEGATPWIVFVPDAPVTVGRVRAQVIEAMHLLSARILSCPTGSGGAASELADLARTLRDLGAD